MMPVERSPSPIDGKEEGTGADGRSQEPAVPVALPPARLGHALREGVRATWDRLGLVIAVSLTWTLFLSLALAVERLLPAALPPLARLGVVVLSLAVVLAGPTAGVFYMAHLVGAHEEVSYLDFWRGGLRMLGPALRLSLLNLLVLSVLAINLWFYLHLGGLFGGAATLICLYVLLFWSLMAVYEGPLLAAQEMRVFDEPERRARRGALAVLRRAFFLALGNAFYSLGLLAALLVLCALLFITLALPALLGVGLVAMLTTYALRALLVRYAILPAPPVEEPVPDEKFRIADKKKEA